MPSYLQYFLLTSLLDIRSFETENAQLKICEFIFLPLCSLLASISEEISMREIEEFNVKPKETLKTQKEQN